MTSMMQCPSQPVARQAPFPAPAQVALALVILKSKPSEMIVEDYLINLQHHITHDRKFVRVPASQHLDGAAYWKQACRRAEEEKAIMLDKLYELEKQMTITTSPSFSSSKSPPAKDRKRKREDLSVAKANSRSKTLVSLRRMPTSPENYDDVQIDNLAGMQSCPRQLHSADHLQTGPVRLLRSFFALRMQLISKTPDPLAIKTSAVSLCRAISVSITTTAHDTRSGNPRNDEGAGVWLAVRRAYGSILEGIKLLCTGSQTAGCAKIVISELAKIVADMLSSLRVEARQEQHKRRGLHLRERLQSEPSHASKLTNLIVYMITELDCDTETYREIFEALTHTFFQHLGTTLSVVVFAEPMHLAQPPPDGLLSLHGMSTESGVAGSHDYSEVLEVSPYLVDILQRVMSMAKGEKGPLGLPSSDKGAVGDGGVATTIRTKMQNTLLRGLFGDQNEAFHDALMPPQIGHVDDPDDSLTCKDESTTSAWFIGEVWKYVGWDILTNQTV